MNVPNIYLQRGVIFLVLTKLTIHKTSPHNDIQSIAFVKPNPFHILNIRIIIKIFILTQSINEMLHNILII